MSFYDTYDYWTLDEDWFVAGYAVDGKTAAQFRPTRATMIQAIANTYQGNVSTYTTTLMETELAWHKKQGELV